MPAVIVRVSQRQLPTQHRLPLSLLRAPARAAVAAAGRRDPVEISLTLVGDGFMRELNRAWRGVDEPTDVLAFPLEEGKDLRLPPGMPRLLGDVVVSLDTARRQAVRASLPVEEEVARLVTHGVLHLLGYDHSTRREREEMRAKEKEVLDMLKTRRFL